MTCFPKVSLSLVVHGPWASPIVLAKKKDGTARFCVDFRRLNDCTRKDA